MDRTKTKKALQDAMKKLGNAPRRKVSGMSPGQRRAITGSATGKTTREKLMDAFKKAKPTGRPKPIRKAAEQLKSRGMGPAAARNQIRKMGPAAGVAGMRKLAGAMPGIAAGAAMNKAVMQLARKIKPTGRLNTDDIKNATGIMKQAMKTMKGTKGK